MKKRILFVISTLDTGGAQRVVSNITMHMPEEWEIDILLNNAEAISYPYRGNIISLGMKPQKALTIAYQIKVFVLRTWHLYKLKRTGKYAACISFLDSANFANIMSGNKYCKTIVSVHSNLSMSVKISLKYKYIVKPLVISLYNKADKVVAVSKGVEGDLKENFRIRKENLATIYNGYDVDSIMRYANEKVLEEQELFKGKVTIITMGRLDNSKGQWNLIKAFAKIHEEFPETQLLLLGEGELFEILNEMAEKLGISDCVVFKGFVDNPFKYIKHSQLFVFPSIYEGFPNALVEAMACGAPVIAADCESGVREILAPDTPIKKKNTRDIEEAEYGIIVPVGSDNIGKMVWNNQDELLVNAMEKILRDEDYRTKYCKKSVVRAKELSIEKAVGKWLYLID